LVSVLGEPTGEQTDLPAGRSGDMPALHGEQRGERGFEPEFKQQKMAVLRPVPDRERRELYLASETYHTSLLQETGTSKSNICYMNILPEGSTP